MVEKPKIYDVSTNIVIVGQYVMMWAFLIKSAKPSVNGEIQLTDDLSKLDEVYGI